MERRIKKNSINFALTLFGKKIKEIVLIDCIEKFFPKNKSDFNRGRKYKVWWSGKKGIIKKTIY